MKNRWIDRIKAKRCAEWSGVECIEVCGVECIELSKTLNAKYMYTLV